jgi:uncharacterized Zn finger protein
MNGIVLAFVACLISDPTKCTIVQLEVAPLRVCQAVGGDIAAVWMRLNPGHHVSPAVCKQADTPA